MTKISIIVPVHNTAVYLRQCLDSIRAQTVTNIEIICVDDASTDGSSEILAEYASVDSRIRVLSMPEAVGPGKARNKGIEAAIGQYVGFVDSDDYITDTMYERLLSAFECADCIDFTVCGIEKFSDNRGEKFTKGEHEKILSPLAGKPLKWSDLGDSIFDIRFVCWNRMYRMDFIRSSRAMFSEGIFYEDLIFHFRVFTAARQFCYINESHYKNRRQRSGATTFEQSDRIGGLVTALKQLDEYLSGQEQFKGLQEKLAYFSYKKLLEHFHKSNLASMPFIYEYLKFVVSQRISESNKYLGEADHEYIDAITRLAFDEFLAQEYWRSKTEVARLKRVNRSLRLNKDTIGNLVGSMSTVKLSTRRIFLWKVLRKIGVPAVIVNNKSAAKNKDPLSVKTTRNKLLGPTEQSKNPKSSFNYQGDSHESRHDVLDFLRAQEVDKLNRLAIERVRREIQSSGRKLRVGFLVNDRTKWNGGSLLGELSRTGTVECGFVCTLSNNSYKLSRDERQAEYAANRQFFEGAGPIWVDLYDADMDLPRSVEENGCDLLILQQPWGMKDYPRRLIGRTLCAYIHYGFVIMANHGMHYNISTFHPYLWKYFTQTESHRQMHLEHDPSAYDKLEVTGYPKLDVYLEPAKPRECVTLWKHHTDSARKRVIFAPHHSLGKNTLKMATFRWSGKLMKDLAAATEREIDWVYKPHPNLKYSIWRSKVMTKSEYQAYVADWQYGANTSIYDEGHYFDLFRSSDALITDCGSFLAEYLPTGRPIIWLIADNTIGLNAVGKDLSEGFYKVRNAQELRTVFDAVVLRGEDPLKEVRLAKIRSVLPNDHPSAENVAQYIRGAFLKQSEPHGFAGAAPLSRGRRWS